MRPRLPGMRQPKMRPSSPSSRCNPSYLNLPFVMAQCTGQKYVQHSDRENASHRPWRSWEKSQHYSIDRRDGEQEMRGKRERIDQAFDRQVNGTARFIRSYVELADCPEPDRLSVKRREVKPDSPAREGQSVREDRQAAMGVVSDQWV